MRINKVLVSGFIFGIMMGLSVANNSVKDIEGIRNVSSSSAAVPEKGESEKKLSRKRRFISFPLGSSFSVAVCMTIGVLGNPNYQYLSLGLNWGLAYELPNSTWVLQNAHGFGKKTETPEPVVKRRYRRELYQRVELIMDRFPNDFYFNLSR